MPGIVRKLIIFAAVDGLVLQPVGCLRPQSSQRQTTNPLKIKYGSPYTITRAAFDDKHATRPDSSGEAATGAYLEVYGILGLLKICDYAYVISISRRTQVAQIWGRPIYAITGIAILPLSSQEEAQQAIDEERARVARHERRERKSHPAEDLSGTEGEAESDGDVGVMSGDQEGTRRSSSGSVSTTFGDEGAPLPEATGAQRIAEDVFKKRDTLSSMANRWLPKSGWVLPRSTQKSTAGADLAVGESKGAKDQGDYTAEPAKMLAASPEECPEKAPSDELNSPNFTHPPDLGAKPLDPDTDLVPRSTIAKIVQTTRLLFGSRTFFYSYDVDLTHSLADQRSNRSSDLPLFNLADPQYFWNSHISESLVDRGYGDYVIPVMQGFVGQRQFTLATKPARVPPTLSTTTSERTTPASTHSTTSTNLEPSLDAANRQDENFLLTLVSRRSIRRAGLRYLRRGIDGNGNTANANETEQILSSPDWTNQLPIWSFMQVRGSIPVFFSQTPYTFKPKPVLTGTEASNESAIRKHFSDLVSRYGKVHVVSLVDRHGTEVSIGETYEQRVRKLNEQGGINGNPIGFEWFEFHKVCRGMKFENVAQLVDSTKPFLDSCGWTMMEVGAEALSTGKRKESTQSGVARTNCMDCLDRTNVVQSAFAQYILSAQLASIGHSIDLQTDPATSWFNTLWADNGDAISRAYAGTAALKGDYTRTRKRNALGALTDLSLTISRYRHNIFADFFAQTCIDYLLGGVTENVFVEYEANLTTVDPAIDVNKVRQEAISTAADMVIADDSENFIGGWPVATPSTRGSLRSLPLEEAVLLLTDAAMYAVRFDWVTGKVRAFERVELRYIVGITWGTYITEVNTSIQLDEKRNIGCVITYLTSDDDADSEKSRVNTRSLDSSMKSKPEPNASSKSFLAFKALSSRTSVVQSASMDSSRTSTDATRAPALSERDSIRQMCQELYVAAAKAKSISTGPGQLSALETADEPQEIQRDEDILAVEEAAIISADSARRNAGYLERIGYGIKKYVWG